MRKPAAVPSPPDERLVYTVIQAATAIGVGENRLYELVNAGKIPAIKWGPHQIVIPKVALEKFLVDEAFKQQEERKAPSELSMALALARTPMARRRAARERREAVGDS